MPLISRVVRQSTCPGLVRIVEAIDGGLCRIKLLGGQLKTNQVYEIADAAIMYGSGIIEITNRANLQIRGIQRNKEAELIKALIRIGLGPFSELESDNTDLTIISRNDDIRNLMLNPLAGLDPSALLDTRILARQIFMMLIREPRCTELSPKFSIQLDGGESIAVLDHPHDIWLSPFVHEDGIIRLACGISGCPPVDPDDPPALICIKADQAVDFVRALLLTFLDLASTDMHRMFDLTKIYDTDTLLSYTKSYLPFQTKFDSSLTSWRRISSDAALRFGAHVKCYQNNCYSVGAQFVLGCVDSNLFSRIALLIDTYGKGSISITPWKGIFIHGVSATNVSDLLSELNTLGLVTSSSEKLSKFVACVGSSGCAKGRADTKRDALVLAQKIRGNRLFGIHMSGCERYCALSWPTDFTLLAVSQGKYDIYSSSRDHVFNTSPLARCLTINQIAAFLDSEKFS